MKNLCPFPSSLDMFLKCWLLPCLHQFQSASSWQLKSNVCPNLDGPRSWHGWGTAWSSWSDAVSITSRIHRPDLWGTPDSPVTGGSTSPSWHQLPRKKKKKTNIAVSVSVPGPHLTILLPPFHEVFTQAGAKHPEQRGQKGSSGTSHLEPCSYFLHKIWRNPSEPQFKLRCSVNPPAKAPQCMPWLIF